LNTGYPGLKQLVKATSGLATYIANNAAANAGATASGSRLPS
jgi:hypothetical protein